jgi:hypothetical protein
MVHTASGSWKTENWFQKSPVWCPAHPNDRPDEIIVAIANSSPYNASSGSSPLKLIATNIGCNKYVGEASGTVTYGTPQTSTYTQESFTVTGIVYKRTLADSIQSPRFIYDLTAGKVSWSMSGHEGGCTLKAGPVTADLQYGQLERSRLGMSSSPGRTAFRRGPA